MQQTTFIYTLTHPITNEVRYEGKTNKYYCKRICAII